MAFEVDAKTVRTIERTLVALQRKMARGSEEDVRRRAREGDETSAALVRRWNREDGAKNFPLCLPDGSDVTSVAQVAALMKVDAKVAAVYVLEQKDVPVSLRTEAKKFFPPPESDNSGVAIMFYPNPSDAKQLSIDGGAAWSTLHITAGYFGNITDSGVPEQADLMYVVSELAKKYQPFDVVLNGLTRFSAPDSDPIVVNADSPMLEDFRRSLVEMCGEEGINVDRKHGYTPHMTLGYSDHDTPAPLTRWTARTIKISDVVLGYGDTYTHVQLGTGETKDVFNASLGSAVSSLRTRSYVVERFSGRVRQIALRRKKKKTREVVVKEV